LGLTLVTASGMVACAEWAGSELGGPRLSIVPLIAIGSGTGTVLLDDLDQLHVLVVPISSTGVGRAVIDTTVPVDAAGNATLTVPVVVVGKAQPFEVTLEGIRSSDGAVLYAGVDTVVVSGAGAAQPVTVPVSYVGPCRIGSGCVVTVSPQDTTLTPGGSFVMRVSVDSALIPVAGVPVALTNLTPGLILVGPDRTVTALLSPTGGAGRVEAVIRGVADSLVVMVGDALTLPGSPIALALVGGRSFGVGKVAQPMAIDVVVDLKAVPTELLGSYDARLTWNAGVLRFDSTQAGSFVSP